MGVLATALLGRWNLDVSDIDPDTVRLEGVAPLRFDFEDVAAPFVPLIGKHDPFACTTAGPDGFTDMTLKFDNQAVVAALALGPVSPGDVLVLQVTGASSTTTPRSLART